MSVLFTIGLYRELKKARFISTHSLDLTECGVSGSGWKLERRGCCSRASGADYVGQCVKSVVLQRSHAVLWFACLAAQSIPTLRGSRRITTVRKSWTGSSEPCQKQTGLWGEKKKTYACLLGKKNLARNFWKVPQTGRMASRLPEWYCFFF